MVSVKPKPGQWYLAATCKECKCKILVFPDLNNGEANLKGSFVVTCPKCKLKGAFEVEHYHHRERRKPELSIEII